MDNKSIKKEIEEIINKTHDFRKLELIRYFAETLINKKPNTRK